MINALVEAISVSINAEFGSGYDVYREEKKQGLREPCFFIFCINPTGRLFLNKRYFRESQFCIQYFPSNDKGKNEECYGVAEQLSRCLEWLDVQGDTVMGTKMSCEVVDGILHFFVNYDLFVYKITDPIPVMEEIKEDIYAKG